MNNKPLFNLQNISKGYRGAGEKITIFTDLTVSINAGDFLAIMGPSGSGKTTLLNLLAGIDRPDGGQILFGAQRLDTMTESKLSRWRAENVGFVFQHFNLLPMLSVMRNVELPLMLTDLSATDRREKVATALDLVGLADCGKRLPSQLSGGQQQRVAIARSIVSDSKLILCDEPTGNLDRAASTDILAILKQLNEEFGKTIVIVTHDPLVAATAQYCWHLDKGRFDIYANPEQESVLIEAIGRSP